MQRIYRTRGMLGSKYSRKQEQVLVGSQGKKHVHGDVATAEQLDTMRVLVISLKRYLMKRILSSIS
jgi:hypothetical protein